jgi:hypothetical protein
LNRFVDFCDLNNGDKLVFSYGDDMGVKQENIGLYNYVAVMQKFMDNKSILTSEAKHIREITADSRMNGVNMCYYLRKADPTMRTVGCGGLWKHFNEPEPVRLDKMKAEAHDPVYDCHSLLAAINHLSRKGHYMPII